MHVILILIGLILIAIGGFYFLRFLWEVLKMITVPFWSEKKLDKELFKGWKKEEGYRDFEKKIDKGI